MLHGLMNSPKKFLMCDGMGGKFTKMHGGGGWGPCGGGRPRRERPTANICREPAHPVTVFSFMFLLHRNGLWDPENKPEGISGTDLLAAFRKEVLEPRQLTDDMEVWPLVEPLGVTRDQADEAAVKRFSGYSLCWNYDKDKFNTFDKPFLPERRFCVEPALALGIMARINDSFYHAGRTPDYSIGAICAVGAGFSDPRLSGEPMYPLWTRNLSNSADKES